MPTIFIDNKPYEVKEGLNLLHAVISRGLDLPYFCWHPSLGSIGACRQCAVQHYKDENDTTGRTVMACMTPVGKDMRFSLAHPTAVDFRARVIEWMMTNHPHDCPVCDEGGECHLQDMTVMTKHNYRRFRFKKRTFKNQYLGPFVNHEMNRCITCYRCVRYYQGVAGGSDLAAFSTSNRVYFGRFEDGTLENEFSGNLVEICPTGVFTDKPFKETYTRKWDLQTAPSVCQLCSLGCNTLPGERYGSIRRIQNRYNPFVNGYFLCDRGRFGHSFVNSPERITAPSFQAQPFKASDRVIGIGSPRASLETNFALRQSVGKENFYLGLTHEELALYKRAFSIMEKGAVASASLHDVEQADAILILGEDVTNTAPMLALAIRKSAYEHDQAEASKDHIQAWHDQAVRNLAQGTKAPLISATSTHTKLDITARESYHNDPTSLALMGFQVAHLLTSDAPGVSDLGPKECELAVRIANFLGSAKKPVIISGTSLQSTAVIEAAANIASALHVKGLDVRLCLTVPEVNSLGLTMLGEQSLQDALNRVKDDRIDAALVVESDISRRYSATDFASFFAHVPQVIAIDYLQHDTSTRASTLPATPFSEMTGTVINNEGRAQRYYSVFVSKHNLPETWRTIGDLCGKKWHNLDHLSDELCEEFPLLKPWKDHVARASFRMLEQKIPRQTQEWSGRTAVNADVSISEAAPPKDPDSPLSHSMEGFSGHPPAELTPFFWAPGWNSVQALNKYLIDVDGDYKNDHLGFRLFKKKDERASFFKVPSQVLRPMQGQWHLVPRHFIFGSEERASYSQALSERITKAHLALNEDDARSLKINDGALVSLSTDSGASTFIAVVDPAVMPGFAIVPLGLGAFKTLWLPKTGSIHIVEAQA